MQTTLSERENDVIPDYFVITSFEIAKRSDVFVLCVLSVCPCSLVCHTLLARRKCVMEE